MVDKLEEAWLRVRGESVIYSLRLGYRRIPCRKDIVGPVHKED